MKKVFVILIALAATMVACNKVADVNEPQESVKEIVFNMEVKQADAQDTKAVKTGWEDGDKVYVFFKGLVGTNKYAIFSYDGSAWTKSANAITAEDLAASAVADDKQLTAVYFPFGTPVFTAAGDYYTVSAEQSYYLSVNTTYTSAVVDASLVLTAELNMTIPDGFVQFSMPNTDGTNTFFRETPVYTLTDTENHLAPVSVSAITPGSAPTQAVGSYGNPLTGYFYGEGNARCILFSGILEEGARGNSTTYNFTFVNKNDNAKDYDDVTYKYSVTATLYQGTSSWRAVKFPLISSSRWKVPEPGYVTVGGIRWATWNIGASSPVGYGDYYSWGGVYPQFKYLGAYHETEIDTDLPPTKDVVTQKLGDSWRMPTQTELETLRDIKSARGSWEENYMGSGVNCIVIPTDNGEGYLILPSAGLYSTIVDGIGSPFYWSSTKNASYGMSMYGASCTVAIYARVYGFSVRPVLDVTAGTESNEGVSWGGSY